MDIYYKVVIGLGELDALLRGVNAGADSKENDEELVADMTKLTSLVEMLLYQMDDFILEVHVAPMCILNTKLKDIKRLKFYMLYDWTLPIDISHNKKIECQELFSSLLQGEFDDVQLFEPIEFVGTNTWEEPTIQLYSVFKDFDFESEIADDYVYMWLYEFVKDGNYAISLPYSFSRQTHKSIIFHCKTPSELAKLSRIKPEDGLKGMYKLEEYVLNKSGYIGVVYTPILSTKCIQYELPYYYVSADSFDLNRIDDISSRIQQSN